VTRALAALAFAAVVSGCQCNGKVVPPGCDGGACAGGAGGGGGGADGSHPGDAPVCTHVVQSAAAADSSWRATGPSGGRVSAAVAVPGAVLVGTGYTRGFGLISGRGGSIFRSTDQGKTFAPVLRAPGSTVGALVAVSGSNRVYAGLSSLSGATNDGVYVSDDSGATFTAASTGLFPQARVQALAVAAGTPERVYALVLGTMMNPGAAVSSLWRRDDSGAWTQLAATGLNPTAGGPALALVADATDRDRVYLADGAAFYTSTNAGDAFTPTAQMSVLFGGQSFANVTVLRNDPANAMHLLLGTEDDGLLETTDQGTTWARVSNPSFIYDVQLAGGALWVATQDTGLLTGADSSTLARTGECLVDPSVTAIAVLPDATGVIVAGTTGGAYVSTDAAKTFAPSDGLDELLARVVASGDSLWLLSALGVYRSKDSGDHWSRIAAGLGSIAFSDAQLDPGDSDVAWLATDSDLFESHSPATGLVRYQLSDGGVHRPLGLGPNVAAVRLDDAGHVWAYQRAATTDPSGANVVTGVYVSDDSGGTFNPTPLISGSLVLKTTFRLSPLELRQDGVLFAGGTDGGPELLVSDGGAPTVAFNDPTVIVYGVHIAPNGDAYLVGRNGPGITRSTDGVTFTESDLGLDGGVYALGFSSTGVLAATGAGVWLAPVGGTYAELTGGWASPLVWSVAVAPGANVAVATTNAGVYRRALP